MSLLLNLETLLRQQEVEKRAILSGTSEKNQEIALYIFERTKVTIEDLKREYDSKDVMELCLRTKLKVNMTHLNCVYDAKKRLEAKGRLANRSNRFIDQMLAKAVNRRMVSPYSEDDVAEYKYINLCEFKKDNNLRLDRWKKKFIRQPDNNLREDQEPEHRSLPTPQNEARLDNFEEPSAIEAFDVDGIGDDMEEDESNQRNTNEISNIAVPQVVAQPDWLQDIDEINSESMTLCSNELLQTQTQSQSQVLGADYMSFNTQVQTTSTQDSAADKFL